MSRRRGSWRGAGRRAGFPGRLRCSQVGAEAVEVVGQGEQIPFEADFGEAAQAEAPEPGHFLDDAEDRLDGLLA